MPTPLVSVIIPTYQRPDMLGRAIESVLSQSYPAVECVVVDDNLPESEARLKTLNIVKRYPQVTYIQTPGKIGGGSARNLACRQAQGAFLTFLDDDDVYEPTKVEDQVSFMRNTACDMSYTDVAMYTPSGNLVEYRKNDYVQHQSQKELLKQHILHHIGPSSVYMITADAFARTPGFGEVSMGQDWYFMLGCIEAQLTCCYLPVCGIKQYLHDGERISTRQNKIDGENELYFFKQHYEHLFSVSERRYLAFRHYAVLAFASYRSHDMKSALFYAIKTVLTSPMYTLKEAKRYFKNED